MRVGNGLNAEQEGDLAFVAVVLAQPIQDIAWHRVNGAASVRGVLWRTRDGAGTAVANEESAS
jgi:hypothetical protein